MRTDKMVLIVYGSLLPYLFTLHTKISDLGLRVATVIIQFDNPELTLPELIFICTIGRDAPVYTLDNRCFKCHLSTVSRLPRILVHPPRSCPHLIPRHNSTPAETIFDNKRVRIPFMSIKVSTLHIRAHHPGSQPPPPPPIQPFVSQPCPKDSQFPSPHQLNLQRSREFGTVPPATVADPGSAARRFHKRREAPAGPDKPPIGVSDEVRARKGKSLERAWKPCCPSVRL